MDKNFYDVGIGIRDGTKNLNDIYRLDRNGCSTYEKVVSKIRLCQEYEYKFGLLSVINPEANGADVYNHFTKELRLRYFDFLLPDANYGCPLFIRLKNMVTFWLKYLMSG